MLRLADRNDLDQHLVAALRTGDVAFADGLVAEALDRGSRPIDVLGRLAHALRRAADGEETARRANNVTDHLLDVTLRGSIGPARATADRVVVAGAPGERRSAGLRLAASAAECAGYDAFFLGSPEPFVLARLVTEQRPVAVLLGADRLYSLAALHQSIAAVHISAPDACVLAFGRVTSGRTRVLGACVAEDLGDVVRLLPSRLACAA